jgi:hypothetical protein
MAQNFRILIPRPVVAGFFIFHLLPLIPMFSSETACEILDRCDRETSPQENHLCLGCSVGKAYAGC